MTNQLPQNVNLQESYTETSNGICVSVRPTFISERSDQDNDIYVFQYHIQLTNQRSETVQLINRHWRVFSGKKQIADVKGDGVVGEQPLLAPSGSFAYSSWTEIHDSFGWMEGSFTFISEELEFFDCQVPKFLLVYIDLSSVH